MPSQGPFPLSADSAQILVAVHHGGEDWCWARWRWHLTWFLFHLQVHLHLICPFSDDKQQLE